MQNTGNFRGYKDTPIFWQSWEVVDPTAVIIIAHGLGEHGGRYAEFAGQLQALNYSVFAIDHRGHGRSGGRRAYIEKFQYAIDDLGMLIEQIAASQSAPLILFGHSMGGAIATAYAMENQGRLAALVLSGAALSSAITSNAMKMIGSLISKVLPRLPAIKLDPALVSRDPEEVQKYATDLLNHHGAVPIRTISEMLATIDQLYPRFPDLQLPLLIMHGSDDKLIPKGASEMLYERCGSLDKTLKIYPELYHEILNELPVDRTRVVADICEWLSARFP